MIGTCFGQKVVMTSFDPAQHGFQFTNSFRNEVGIGPLKIVTKGRCGGMVYAALDYYRAKHRMPTMTATPDPNHELAKYILDRQYKSMSDMGTLFTKKLLTISHH
jgi:hypothetical protein